MAQPKFIFRLEPLLDLRKQQEKEQQRRVAVIQQEINTLIARIRQSEEMIRDQDHALTASQLSGRLDLVYIATEKRYVGTLRLLIANTIQKVANVEHPMVQARAELLAAAKARKVIEKLRERQFARWQAELLRKENAEMDEIGTQLALRKIAETGMAIEELV